MLLCAEPTASFPAKIGAKSGTLTIRIYNSRDQQTPPEAVSLLVNGCAAHDWGQVLTIEGKNGHISGHLPVNLRIKWADC